MNKAAVDLTVSIVRGVTVSGGLIVGYNMLSKSSEDSNIFERFYQKQAIKIGVKLPHSKREEHPRQQQESSSHC